MQVVVDTNILISAIFFGGKPELILKAWRTGKLDLLITEEILSEYVGVLHRAIMFTKHHVWVIESKHPEQERKVKAYLG